MLLPAVEQNPRWQSRCMDHIADISVSFLSLVERVKNTVERYGNPCTDYRKRHAETMQ